MITQSAKLRIFGFIAVLSAAAQPGREAAIAALTYHLGPPAPNAKGAELSEFIVKNLSKITVSGFAAAAPCRSSALPSRSIVNSGRPGSFETVRRPRPCPATPQPGLRSARDEPARPPRRRRAGSRAEAGATP